MSSSIGLARSVSSESHADTCRIDESAPSILNTTGIKIIIILGVTVISHDAYWADLISDAELHEAKAEALARGFVLKDKEHLANFRAFEQAFGPGGAAHPTKRRLGLGLGCAGCCFEIGEATFCEVCGAYPAQRQAQK